jgi:hypothetical protein
MISTMLGRRESGVRSAANVPAAEKQNAESEVQEC